MTWTHGKVALLQLTLSLLHVHRVGCTTVNETSQSEEPPYSSEAEISARESALDDESLTSVEVARASVVETESGEVRYDDQNDIGSNDDSHSYEVALQKLQAEQSQNGENTLSDQQVAALQTEALRQEDRENPSVIDTPAMLSPPQNGSITRHKRQLVANPRSRWDGGIVPYDFLSAKKKETAQGQTNIKAAFWYLESNSCLRFPQWTSTLRSEMNLNHNNYLRFGYYGGRCWSFVGNLRGRNGQDISACGRTSTALHEIGHALGMTHEQNRADRDQYIELHPENAKPGAKGIFSGPPRKGYDLYHDYDLGSMMQYASHFFTWNGRPTIVALDPDQRFLMRGKSDTISHYDLMTIAVGYKCADKCPKEKQSTKCENDGFLTVQNGVCMCRCVAGLGGETCNEIKRNDKSISNWPTGDYGITMTKEGCPSTDFQTGSRYHALQRPSYVQDHVPSFLKPSYSQSHMEDQFCMLEKSTSRKSKWGKGKYCIYQKTDSCPEGFTSGYILFDDEKTGDTKNKINGAIPKGQYGKDTKYYYCCRSDGIASIPINLPTDKPFHLFRKGGTCQNVQGMGVTAYHFSYNVDNVIKQGLKGGMYPDYTMWYGYLHLYYCYYYKLNRDCGDVRELTDAKPMTLVTSPNYPKNYNIMEECNWLIKSPQNSRIHIEMLDMDIGHYTRFECSDSLEMRTNMIGQKGFRYCGTNMKRSIVSDENRVMLTFRSNVRTTKKGFKVKLSVIPDSSMCYNMRDKGASYRGKVDYTQYFQRCISWEKAKHCRVNPFNINFMDKGLIGNNFCRNPNNAHRPWCYFNQFCDINYCDVCGIEHCYDVYSDCKHQIERNEQFCSSEHGFTGCHKTCGLCGRGISNNTNSAITKGCRLPTPKDAEATVTASDAEKESVAVGESVTLQCSYSKYTVTSSVTCLSDGNYAGQDPFCHLKCPVGWSRNKGYCYMIINEKKHFKSAQDDCQALGASLTSVQSAEENAFLLKMTRDFSLPTIFIGLTNDNSVKQFKWIDGAAISYTNWKKNQPNGGKEHCVVMTSDGTWNDIYCEWFYPQPFMCKMPFTGNDTPCADERVDCLEIITRNPDVCKVQPVFATRFCRSTCGICSQSSNIKCKHPGGISNANMASQVSDLIPGDFVEYTCTDGYVHTSGDLKRACISNGRVTGKPPVCSPVENEEETIGFRRISRSNADLDQSLVIYDTKPTTFSRRGVIKSWKVYSSENADLVVQVWRRPNADEKNTFTLIGSNMINVRKDRENTYHVPTFERIEVQAGDMIGWYYPNGAVGLVYDRCDNDYASYGYHQAFWIDRIDHFYRGMKKTVRLTSRCRVYSIAAVLSPGESSKSTNVASLKYGSKCTSSFASGTCGRAFDGRLNPSTAEWISDGGVGTWMTVEFPYSYTVFGLRIMQRHCACGQNKALKVEFSDGSSQHVTLTARPGRSHTDEYAMGWDAFHVPYVDTKSVKITVESVYSTNNNGFIEIEVHAVCRTGFQRFRNSCYRLQTAALRYQEAEDVCLLSSAQLTSVADVDENKFLMDLKAKHKVAMIFIGLSDRANDDEWIWEDRSQSTYRNWKKGQPPTGSNNRDCAVHRMEGTWSTQTCTSLRYRKPYVCKWTFKEKTKEKSPTVTIGNDAKRRFYPKFNGPLGFILVTTKNTIPFDGKVDSWIIYASNPSLAVMQVWRRQADGSTKFSLVGNNYVRLQGGMVNIIKVPEFGKIKVKKGDFIGFYVPKSADITFDASCPAQDKGKVHYVFPKNGMKDMLKSGLVATGYAITCMSFSIGAVISPERVYKYTNVASATNGGTCKEASSNQAFCGRVLDGGINPPLQEWKTNGATQGVGAWLRIDFADSYTVEAARIMQRSDSKSQSKDLSLTFSDDSTQSVTLANGYFWNDFELKPVVTNSVKISVTSVYSTKENGFIEIELYAGCRGDWLRFQDGCYKRFTGDDQFFFVAEDICQRMGGHITSIHSKAENDFIVSKMDASVSSFHVGITDNRAEGIWLCLDATKGSYTNWYPGEPSSERKHHCARIEKLNGQWRSLSCTQYKKPFICKRSLKVMPVGETKYLSMDSITNNVIIGKNIKGTVHNAQLVQGVSGMALSLNGVNSSVSLDNHRAECFGNLHLCLHGYTLSLRLKMEDVVGRVNEFYISNGGEDFRYSHGIALFRTRARLRCIFRDQTKRWAVWANPLQAPVGKWLCVTLTWSKADGLTMYIGGRFVQKDTKTSAVKLWSNTKNNFVIGRSSAGKDYGKGLIDELHFWPQLLPQSKVTEICGGS